jgi:hypothetical protein
MAAREVAGMDFYDAVLIVRGRERLHMLRTRYLFPTFVAFSYDSIIRRRRGLIAAIGLSCLRGGLAQPKSSQMGDLQRTAFAAAIAIPQ